MNRLLAWLNDDGPNHPDWHLALYIGLWLTIWTFVILGLLIGGLVLDTTTTY